jgi:hypothetical protein
VSLTKVRLCEWLIDLMYRPNGLTSATSIAGFTRTLRLAVIHKLLKVFGSVGAVNTRGGGFRLLNHTTLTFIFVINKKTLE